MASIETVDFGKWVSKHEQTNISDVVGAGERNNRNDVMLVQTLFKLVGFSDFYSRKHFGLQMKDLPEPTGVCDAKTIRAIWGFQRTMAHLLLNIDGKVHPASYKNRVMAKGPQARQMMITLLNGLAQDGAIMNNYVDVISAVNKISPSIVFA